jgi:hypothetical protein
MMVSLATIVAPVRPYIAIRWEWGESWVDRRGMQERKTGAFLSAPDHSTRPFATLCPSTETIISATVTAGYLRGFRQFQSQGDVAAVGCRRLYQQTSNISTTTFRSAPQPVFHIDRSQRIECAILLPLTDLWGELSTLTDFMSGNVQVDWRPAHMAITATAPLSCDSITVARKCYSQHSKHWVMPDAPVYD